MSLQELKEQARQLPANERLELFAKYCLTSQTRKTQCLGRYGILVGRLLFGLRKYSNRTRKFSIYLYLNS